MRYRDTGSFGGAVGGANAFLTPSRSIKKSLVPRPKPFLRNFEQLGASRRLRPRNVA